ncbi:hypothetical protein F383_27222 [Gossypium arboreum]|uniref:Uncharacterized protein n=1 Tax=Gossypium arboreum TaxID=29729 RepID=A0A0B0MP54_GOSAR|nr:hypothetical protein F383_27222 [Gossypium arboreum]
MDLAKTGNPIRV